MKILAQKTDLAPMIEATPLLLVQIGAKTCAPCTAIRERIDRWCAEHPKTDCIYLPIEEFPDLAAELGVFSVPTVLLYADGRLTLRESGYFSLDSLLQSARRYLDLMEV